MNKEDPIKNEDTRVLTLIVRLFRRSGVAYSEVGGGIPPKFELIQAVTHYANMSVQYTAIFHGC